MAVDATRLAAVSAWPVDGSGVRLADLVPALRPRTASSLLLTGRKVTMTFDASPSSTSPDTALVATYVDADGDELTSSLGRVRYGRHQLTAAVPACARTCRLARLRLVRLPGEQGQLIGALDLLRLSVDGREVRGAFADTRAWRPARLDDDPDTSSTATRLSSGRPGLRLTYNASPSATPGAVRADVPTSLPIAVTAGVELDTLGRDGLVAARGVDGGAVPGKVTATVVTLPRLGLSGQLMDLGFAARFSQTVAPDATYQVWASRTAPPPAVVREQLRAAGLRVLGQESVGGRTRALDRSGPALALLLLLGVAVAGMVTAAAAVLVLALVQARRRAYELAALQTAGVATRVLRRATAEEYAVQLAVGAVAGLLCGIGTTGLAGPAVSVLGSVGTVTPVPDTVAWAGVAVVAAVTVVLFSLTTVAVARVGLRFARPDLLREGAA
jgi:putative ABC transport system permease protein